MVNDDSGSVRPPSNPDPDPAVPAVPDPASDIASSMPDVASPISVGAPRDGDGPLPAQKILENPEPTSPIALKEHRPHQIVSEERKKIYLKVLSETGSHAAAASAATPWALSKKCGYESFRDLRKRDPAFAAAVEEAHEKALGLVEKTIADRAIHGWKRPVYQKGILVGHEQCFDNTLLLRLAARLDPAWRERQGVDLTGKLATANASLSLTPDQILALPEDLQQQVVRILEVMLSQQEQEQENRNGSQGNT